MPKKFCKRCGHQMIRVKLEDIFYMDCAWCEEQYYKIQEKFEKKFNRDFSDWSAQQNEKFKKHYSFKINQELLKNKNKKSKKWKVTNYR